MFLDGGDGHGNSLLGTVDSGQNESFGPVRVDTLDVEDAALVIYNDIVFLNHIRTAYSNRGAKSSHTANFFKKVSETNRALDK